VSHVGFPSAWQKELPVVPISLLHGNLRSSKTIVPSGRKVDSTAVGSSLQDGTHYLISLLQLL